MLLAASQGHLAVVEYLHDTLPENNVHLTAVVDAATHGHIRVLQFLLQTNSTDWITTRRCPRGHKLPVGDAAVALKARRSVNALQWLLTVWLPATNQRSDAVLPECLDVAGFHDDRVMVHWLALEFLIANDQPVGHLERVCRVQTCRLSPQIRGRWVGSERQLCRLGRIWNLPKALRAPPCHDDLLPQRYPMPPRH
ncbi:Aste57867_3517 [Aphanomyces stellatus]|uniref:Aste57867_3517 protein n=1 Tax=Aphanomyces stellatus TaxID=120398 RepID=A0A485KFC4_9STRA|nr:hypothetical protein As57867_003506 [Aphanomyces stellatus]VFT80680.1 Aste57867_3517 [Aphanomyces stellatus]